MNSCCFASVIFEGNIPFFPEFLGSLQAQIDSDFTLLLFNDGVENLEAHVSEYTLPFRIITASGTSAEIRQQMLTYLAASEFDFAVFGDTDDYFALNRIAISKKLLKEHPIIANDVWLVDEAGKLLQQGYWSIRPEVKEDISYESLRHYNVLGLGNTAIQTSILPKNLALPASLIAVDWYVFSCLLKSGLKAHFTSSTHIYYRQYEGNTIGLKKLTLQRFKKEATVKLQHYKALAKLDEEITPLALRFEEMVQTLDTFSETQLTKYSKQQEHPFWWEQVQP